MRRGGRLLLLLMISAAAAGCGKDTHQVRGTVTWQGEPVPVGVVQFEPAKEMGDAPSGFALIEDGKFVTEPGRGCFPGPHIARLKGFDGNPSELDESLAAERIPGYEDEPSLAVGTPLFENVTVEVEITAGDNQLTFDLPPKQ